MNDRKLIPRATQPKICLGLIAPPCAVGLCVAINAWLKRRLAEPVDILT